MAALVATFTQTGTSTIDNTKFREAVTIMQNQLNKKSIGYTLTVA